MKELQTALTLRLRPGYVLAHLVGDEGAEVAAADLAGKSFIGPQDTSEHALQLRGILCRACLLFESSLPLVVLNDVFS